MDSRLIAFMVISLVLTVTPGVDTVLVIRNVIRGGRKDGVITSLGVCSGLFFHATISALGVSAVLLQSATIFKIVKSFGAIYLIWLGLSGIRQSLKKTDGFFSTALDSNHGPGMTTASKSFKEGLLSNILNPKPAVFYIALFPQFIDPGDLIILKSLSLVLIQFVLGVCWLSLLSFLLSRMKRILDNAMFRKALASVSGVVLISLGVKIGFEKA